MPTDRDKARPTVGRRALMGGAATLGGLAAAASLVAVQRDEVAQAVLPKTDAAEAGLGYRETEHIKSYYQSTRI